MSIIEHQFALGEIALEPQDIAIEIGYAPGQMPDEIAHIVESESKRFPDTPEIQGGYRLMPCELDDDEFLIKAENVVFSLGRKNFKRYKHADELAVFACSAGAYIAERSKTLMAEGALLEGYVVDVMGSILVERAMDRIQQDLKHNMARDGRKISNRYSPGYCDWHINEQRELFSLLPHRFCGITLTDSCLMMPIKSISGLIGIGEKVRFREHSCEQCNSKTCIYKRR